MTEEKVGIRTKKCCGCGKEFNCLPPKPVGSENCSSCSKCYCVDCLPSLQGLNSDQLTYEKTSFDKNSYHIGTESTSSSNALFACEILDIISLHKKVNVEDIDARHALQIL